VTDATSSARRRILYVTNGYPFPLTSGYLRHYFLIGELARAGYRVVLLSIVGADHRPEHAAAMAAITERTEVFRSLDRASGTRRRFTRKVGRMLRGRGGDPAAVRLAARVAEIMRTEPIDAVVFSGKRTDRVLAELGDLPVVVDMCDATSVRLAREAAIATPARRVVLALQGRQVRQTERRMLDRGDRLLFASTRDEEALLARRGDPRCAVVPNGIDLDRWSRTGRSLGRDTIVFTGAMSYGPNVDAAVRLARSILPIVRRSSPAAQLTIVGRDPTAQVVALGALPGVTVTGFVDDVRPYLEAASVFVAPLRFGAGIQN
jgi:glycosyltransferase involved in cell wall biosynthesis